MLMVPEKSGTVAVTGFMLIDNRVIEELNTPLKPAHFFELCARFGFCDAQVGAGQQGIDGAEPVPSLLVVLRDVVHGRLRFR